jgi:hypothetical protein
MLSSPSRGQHPACSPNVKDAHSGIWSKHSAAELRGGGLDFAKTLGRGRSRRGVCDRGRVECVASARLRDAAAWAAQAAGFTWLATGNMIQCLLPTGPARPLDPPPYCVVWRA